MRRGISRKYLAAALACLFLFAGCAGFGQARYERRAQATEMLAEMMADFENYTVYYSGTSEAFPAGIIFEPEYDDRSIAQKDWIKVESRELTEKLVHKLEQRYRSYRPVLYTLTGEDGLHYGYIYTVYMHVVVRQLEPGSIHVYGMREGPRRGAGP